jgi:hypothetical protein
MFPLLLGVGGLAFLGAMFLLADDRHDKQPDLDEAPPTPTGSLPLTLYKLINKILGELQKAAQSSGIPLGLIVGWIAKESAGKLAEHPQPGPGDTKLDERGYFQLMPDESKTLGLDHQRLSTDSVYSINAGLLLINKYAQKVDGLGIAQHGTPYFWRVVKLWHTMGGGDVEKLAAGAKSAGQAGNWDAFESHALSGATKTKHSPAKWFPLVDKVYEIGAPYGFGGAPTTVVGGAVYDDIPDILDVIAPR